MTMFSKSSMKLVIVLPFWLLIVLVGQNTAYAQWSDWVAPESSKNVKNPIKADETSIATGKMFFEAICVVCHGKEGKGDGVNAPSLEKAPANFTVDRVQKQSDGVLFYKISEGRPPMLSFKNTLSEEQRWHIINYLRTFGNKQNSKVVEVKTDIKKESSTSAPTKQEETATTSAPTAMKLPNDGKQIFNLFCASCHTIGKGVLTGPDLKDVQNRHSEDWILKWVKSSQSLVKSGDPEAVKLFAEFKEVVMPDHNLNDDQIKLILSYIVEKGSAKLVAKETNADVTTADSVPIANYSNGLEKYNPMILYAVSICVLLLLMVGMSAILKTLKVLREFS